MSALTAPPKRTRRKDARPGELLGAALDLFVEKGYAGTRVEDVARRAQVSKGTLFLYFASKEELFKAVVRHHITDHLGEWDEELARFEGSSSEAVHLVARRWWERIGDTQASGITKLVMSEASHFPEIATFYQREVIEPGLALLRRLLQRGIDRGEFCANIDLDHAIYGFLAPMMFLLLWKHSLGPCSQAGRQIDPVAFIETQLQMLLTGLLVRPSPPPPAP
jgi:TetR/AcrR family transcriptional regulator